MEVKAIGRNIRISPKKAWRITRYLRGLSYKKSMEMLREMTPKSARLLEKILKSAFYNGFQKDVNLSEDDLYIREIHVSKGVFLKRMMPRAQGRADVVMKRSSHISVVLVDKE